VELNFKEQYEEPALLPITINEEEEYKVEVRKHRKHEGGI